MRLGIGRQERAGARTAHSPIYGSRTTCDSSGIRRLYKDIERIVLNVSAPIYAVSRSRWNRYQFRDLHSLLPARALCRTSL